MDKEKIKSILKDFYNNPNIPLENKKEIQEGIRNKSINYNNIIEKIMNFYSKKDEGLNKKTINYEDNDSNKNSKLFEKNIYYAIVSISITYGTFGFIISTFNIQDILIKIILFIIHSFILYLFLDRKGIIDIFYNTFKQVILLIIILIISFFSIKGYYQYNEIIGIIMGITLIIFLKYDINILLSLLIINLGIYFLNPLIGIILLISYSLLLIYIIRDSNIINLK